MQHIKELAQKHEELENKYDKQFKIVFDAKRTLMQPPVTPKPKIGFRIEEPKVKYIARWKKEH
ncbi:MAG: hypothetical protein AAB071_07210 [Bacteroidota bacterium]